LDRLFARTLAQLLGCVKRRVTPELVLLQTGVVPGDVSFGEEGGRV